jgi:peptide/nickel transport system permease protein
VIRSGTWTSSANSRRWAPTAWSAPPPRTRNMFKPQQSWLNSPGIRATRFVAAKLLVGAGTLLVVSMLVFLAVHLIPGGYAQVVLGPFASAEAKAQVAAQYGLDQPIPLQFLDWLSHVLTGDLGTSYTSGTPVAELISRKLPVTAELAALALIIALIVGLPLAIVSGANRGRIASGLSRFVGAVALSFPDFVVGSVLVFIFSAIPLWFTVGGYVPFSDDPIENVRAVFLPALTLSVFGVAVLVRTGRDAVASTFTSPHVFAAVARGESSEHVIRHHVLRNSSIPMVTVVATYFGYLLGGAVIVEGLFSLPGMGQAVLNAVRERDYAVVQGVVLVSAALFITINMLADISYGLIDPRTRGVRA